jgi:hypothetical protein
MRSSIFATVTVVDVLRAAGIAAPSNLNQCIQCPLPLHDDSSPSFKVVGANATGWTCFGCGQRGGVADLVVRLGYATDRRGAAEWLEGRLP